MCVRRLSLTPVFSAPLLVALLAASSLGQVNQHPPINSPVPNETFGVHHGFGQTNDIAHEDHLLGHHNYGGVKEHGAQVGNGGVLPHSGQVLREEQDLIIKGRGPESDFKIKRLHLSRVDQPTNQWAPFGPAWAFNYRHTLRYCKFPSPGAADVESFGRKDIYDWSILDGLWHGREGVFQFISRQGDRAYLRTRSGTTIVFELWEGVFQVEGVVVEIWYPTPDNKLTFTYDRSAGNALNWKMTSIKDVFGRQIDFFYEDPLYPTGITRIRDFTGREVLYEYWNDGLTSNGQLVRVSSPSVTSAGGSDYGGRKVRQYGYRNHTDPQLKNALTVVYFPNEIAFGGPERLSWQYEEGLQPTQPFAYVHSHWVGSQSGVLPPEKRAGGDYQYSYEDLGGDQQPNTPKMDVVLFNRRGQQTYLQTNNTGQVLTDKMNSQDLRPEYPSPFQFQRSFTYNPEGDLLTTTEPEGNTTTRVHVPSHHARMSHANETENVRSAGPRGGADIRTKIIYEPLYNKPFQVIDSRAFEPGNTEAQFTTTYIYDYMEDLDAARDAYADDLGMTSGAGGTLEQILCEAGIRAFISDLDGLCPSGPCDLNGDSVTDLNTGQAIMILHPTVTLDPTQAARLGLNTTQEATEIFRFNSTTQITYHKDAEGNVKTYHYHPGNDPAGDGTSDGSGQPTNSGYLASTHRDTTLDLDRNSGQNPPVVDEHVRYLYTTVGSFPANRRGVPTQVIDGRGVATTYQVNEMDQITRTHRAADVSSSSEMGLVAYDYDSYSYYDANDNVIERGVRNRGGLDGLDHGYIVTRMEYDILDHLKRETIDDGALQIVNEYEYDESENLIERTRGVGTPEASTDTWTWDERNILISFTRGAGTPEESTVTTAVDLNGNITKRTDATGGHFEQTFYDGHDRQIEFIDRNGNIQYSFFDAGNNLLREERWGNASVGGGSELLEKTEQVFDERNRLERIDHNLFHYPGRGVGVLDDGDLDPGDGLVSEVLIYDRNSRLVGKVDADDDLFETRYDGLNRVIQTLDPLGNTTDIAHDANNNVTQVVETEVSAMVVADEVFTTQMTYDSLNRRTVLTEPNGQQTRSEYDSRDNLIRTTDELGHQVEMRYDNLSRGINKRWLLEEFATPTGGGVDRRRTLLPPSPNPPPNPGSKVVRRWEVVRNSWDALHRMNSQSDDHGNTTTYSYDTLSRRTRKVYADGTFESWTYNEDDELVTHTNPNGSVSTWTYDAGSRPISLIVDNSGAASSVIGTTLQTWSYDGMDRIVANFDNNSPIITADDVSCEFWYDSLGRRIRERQATPSLPLKDVDTEWEGGHRVVTHTYSDGRRVERTYDALDRLTLIQEPLVFPPLIAAFEYIGGAHRDLRVGYGNGAVLDKRNAEGTQTIGGTDPGYDANRRPVHHQWTGPGGVLTWYENEYNGPGGIGTNRRISETRHHLSGHRDEYTFDNAYRMTSFLRDGTSLSTRTVNGTDKMVSFEDEGVDRTPVVDGDPGEAGCNQYSELDGRSRFYDLNGALRTNSTADYTYCFDFKNRLREVNHGPTLVASYAYDAQNRRVAKTIIGSGTRFLYSNWQVLEELDIVTSLVQRQYVEGRFLDEHIQVKDYTLLDIFFYHCNSQGFVGALSDTTGAPAEYYEYSWFGKPRILAPDGTTVLPTSNVGNSYLFQGRRYDAETEESGGDGLYYFRNRYYDPDTGEFISIDPTGNWAHGRGDGYAAFGGDPWNFKDPMGLNFWHSLGNAFKKIGQGIAKGVVGLGNYMIDTAKSLGKFITTGNPMSFLEQIGTGVMIAGEIAIGPELQFYHGLKEGNWKDIVMGGIGIGLQVAGAAGGAGGAAAEEAAAEAAGAASEVEMTNLGFTAAEEGAESALANESMSLGQKATNLAKSAGRGAKSAWGKAKSGFRQAKAAWKYTEDFRQVYVKPLQWRIKFGQRYQDGWKNPLEDNWLIVPGL